MPHRYVVLWEVLPDGRTRPAGLAVEQDGYVIVETRDDLCIPRRYDSPFTVTGPDFTSVQYTPDHAQYFDHVLLDLSRAFVIGEQDVVMDATDGVVLRLLLKHVLRPLRREHPAAYTMGGRYPVLKAQHDRHYRDVSTAADRAEEPQRTRMSEGSLVAA